MNSIEALLQEKGLEFKPSGHDFLIKCLNPDHEDNNPSLRIDRISGIGHCFACGFSLNLFTYYNKTPNVLNIKLEEVRNKLTHILYLLEGIQLPTNIEHMNDAYRGISADTIKKFGFFTTTDRMPDGTDLSEFILVPLYDANKLVALIGRHKVTDGKPKYKFWPRKATIPIFPPLTVKNNSVILVEGMFDALYLYDNGLENVLCCFGTDSFVSRFNEYEASFKISGVTKFHILFDGDKGGRTGANKTKTFLEKHGYLAEIIELDDGLDPTDLDIEQLFEIKKYINGN